MMRLAFSNRLPAPRSVAIFQNLRLLSSSSHSHAEPSKTNQVQKSDFYDVVVCGGGMVGSAMTYALAKNDLFKHLKIALVESGKKSDEYSLPKIPGNRTCALSKTTVDFFKCNQAW